MARAAITTAICKEALIRAALELIAEKGPAGSPLPTPRAGPASARPRPIGISATATSCWPTWRGAASSSSPPRWSAAWDGGRPDAFDGVRAARQGLSRLRAHRARVLFGDVRSRRSARQQIRNLRAAGERAFAVMRAAAEKLVARMPAARPPAGADGGAAHLVDVARHRLAVRPRRRGAADAADAAGGTAGGRRAGLSARPRAPRGRPARLR